MATGTLVGRMAEIVKEVGGAPVGVLCVVVTGEYLIADPRLVFNDQSPPLRIHAMTTRPIPFVESADIAADKIFKINPVTVLPEEKLLLPNGFRPHFSDIELFDHLESAQAIDFNFYQMDLRRFTTAIRVECLLSEHGDKIWAAIEEAVDRGSAIVTTFNREDVRFKEFVEDRRLTQNKEPKPCVFVHSLETSSSYFLLPPSIEKIQNGHILLLLFSLHTSEKLRNLVSLLASQSVQSITAICLLNRMGLHTSNFVARIKRLLRGIGNGVPVGDAGFTFISLYNLPDIHSDDITRMQQTIGALFQYYSAETRVPSFRRWMNQDQKYFRSHSLTSRDFEEPTSQPLPADYTLEIGRVSITVASQEGKLALLCRNVVESRDYAPFIQEIANLSDKETLYKLFGILLSDLSYLKMTGKFRYLRSTLIERIQSLRERRFELEGRRRITEIEKIVDTETHLLFGVSVFSFLDHEFDYDQFIHEVLTCGREPEEWVAYPENLFQYFGDERVAWNLSMLMHFSHHKFHQPEVAVELKNRMKKAATRFINFFEQNLPQDSEGEARSRKNRVKANLNLLLTELGAHELKAKHQVIRYLHSKVTTPKKGHNPIYSSLDAALLELEGLVSLRESADPKEEVQRVRIDKVETKKLLEDAVYTAGILEEIASAVRQLLFFAQTSRAEAQQFSNEPELPGFSQDTVLLGNIFQNIRINNIVAKSDFSTIVRLRTRIFYALWEPGSYLRTLLHRYIVPFRELIVAALENANQVLTVHGYSNVWDRELAKYRAMETECFVLCEPHLLRETLRNLFTNARHSFAGWVLAEGESWADLVSTDLEKIEASAPPPEETELRDYSRLTVISDCGTFGGFSSQDTLRQHRRDILSYGGSLEIGKKSEERGTVAILTLLARNAPRD